MIHTYMQSGVGDTITCHTRNPAILRMLARVCCGEHRVYPLNVGLGDCLDSFFYADGMEPNTSMHTVHNIPGTTIGPDFVAYHVNRYGEEGLYGPLSGDPADKPSGSFPRLKDRFPGLRNRGTALVVAADYRARRRAGGGHQ
jgi:hypothetical protein